MPREDTQFKKGWKGGPGRPKGLTAREAIRAALSQPSQTPGKTRLQEWADQLSLEVDTRTRLEILKWLEGGSPKESNSGEDPDEPPARDEHGNDLEP